MPKFCGKCGSLLDEQNNKCPKCDIQQYSNKPKRFSLIVISLVAVIIVCISIGIVFLSDVLSDSDSTDNEIVKRNTEVSSEKIEETTILESTEIVTEKPTEETTILESAEIVTEKPTEETTQSATDAKKDFSSYVGSWRKDYPDTNGASVWVNIKSINENNITFYIGNTSANLAHITESGEITSTINDDGEVNFTFNDTFSNYGTGYIKFKDNSIYLKTTFDEYSQPYIWALHADEVLTRSS